MSSRLRFVCFCLVALQACHSLAATFSPARPPAVPLAVRSPYLQAWLPAGSEYGDGGYIAHGYWPQFWTNATLGWVGMIRVDGQTYTWMGLPRTSDDDFGGVPPYPNQTALTYSSTRSIFTLDVDGKVEMNVTYYSPVTPDDERRQSLVFSYLHVDVQSTDGQDHDVQLYADVSGEWASGDRRQIIEWKYDVTDGVAHHQFYRQTPQIFTQINDQAEWGNWWWSSDDSPQLTYQSGSDHRVRGQFANNGTLNNTQDTNYRGILDDWPVFGLAHDLGKVGGSSTGVTWSIGLTQPLAIQAAFTPHVQVEPIPSLWTSYFQDEISAVTFFQKDYADSSKIGDAVDAQVSRDSSAKAGQNYTTITSLSVRQAFAATQLVGNFSNTYLVLKEISSNGNAQTTDVIYPSHPIWLYFNATYVKLLLDPLYANQEAGNFPQLYAEHDLGLSYPNLTGHADGGGELMPVEESGNMLIMTLGYAQHANDTDYLKQHYNLLDQWANYLIPTALFPDYQLTTDDFLGNLTNATNLALKGILGIGAMSRIANLTGNSTAASQYGDLAHQYIQTWQAQAIDTGANPPFVTELYGNSSSWEMQYNMLADKLLGLNLLPQSFYDDQSTFYASKLETYGVPLRSGSDSAKTDWQLFIAAVLQPSLRQQICSAIVHYINDTPLSGPYPDFYSAKDAGLPELELNFTSRPVQGGSFAPLLIN